MEEVSSSVMLWVMIKKKADASWQMLKFCTNTGEEIMTHTKYFFLSASCILMCYRKIQFTQCLKITKTSHYKNFAVGNMLNACASKRVRS